MSRIIPKNNNTKNLDSYSDSASRVLRNSLGVDVNQSRFLSNVISKVTNIERYNIQLMAVCALLCSQELLDRQQYMEYLSTLLTPVYAFEILTPILPYKVINQDRNNIDSETLITRAIVEINIYVQLILPILRSELGM